MLNLNPLGAGTHIGFLFSDNSPSYPYIWSAPKKFFKNLKNIKS